MNNRVLSRSLACFASTVFSGLTLWLFVSGSAIAEEQFSLRASAPALIAPEDLELERLLNEPLLASPLDINFDERGQVWLMLSRQYPWPSGLKLTSRCDWDLALVAAIDSGKLSEKLGPEAITRLRMHSSKAEFRDLFAFLSSTTPPQ